MVYKKYILSVVTFLMLGSTLLAKAYAQSWLPFETKGPRDGVRTILNAFGASVLIYSTRLIYLDNSFPS